MDQDGIIRPSKTNHDKLIAKLREWEAEDGDEQRETLAYLKRELDQYRDDDEKLWPPAGENS